MENTMYFDNAIAIYRQRISALAAKDDYLAERLREKFQWACREDAKRTGISYIKTFYDAVDAAS
tara:strand:+ start:426 stop:617 length:192 start_codon:yes stop_codon:yes gene_type:complete